MISISHRTVFYKYKLALARDKFECIRLPEKHVFVMLHVIVDIWMNISSQRMNMEG